MRRFENKVTLVTGAASGIGQATATRLGQEGAAVFCVDLQSDALTKTVSAIRNEGGIAQGYSCDVSDEHAVAACVADCIQKLGHLDHLSNMAGVLRLDHFHELTLANFNQILAVNLQGTFLMCRSALPHLLKTGGNIVNTASTSALAGVPWAAAYAASKGAVLAMTQSLAIEYAKQGLRANCVCPGDIKTPMMSPVFPEGVDFKLLRRCMSPTGVRGPELVAGVVAMLASADGAHITGEHIRVDGGTLS